MGANQDLHKAFGMTDKDVHDLKNLLRRLEIMADLLLKKDFRTFSEQEIRQDAATDLETIEKLFSLSQ